jgi:hypothetical protein
MVFAACALAACAAAGRGSTESEVRVADAGRSRTPELMDRLVGQWVLTGVVAGQNVVHDVDAAWVLQGNYVRIGEVAREIGANGKPDYEATIFVGWHEGSSRYVCIWLDITEVASGDISCAASPAQDSIPFEFRNEHGSRVLATTFTYHRSNDTWDWQINNVDNGKVTPFATLSLRRR